MTTGRWSRPLAIKGSPPLGQVESRCAGCQARFVAGELYVSRRWGLLALPMYAHFGCADRADQRVAS